MYIEFEPGDLISRAKFSDDEFLHLKTAMMISCIKNHWRFVEDDIVCQILAFEEKNPFLLKKQELLGTVNKLRNILLNAPLKFLQYEFDGDVDSILIMRSLVIYMERKSLLVIDWVDSVNVLHKAVPLFVFKNMLELYCERSFDVNSVCSSIYEQIGTANNMSELEMVPLCDLERLIG